MIDHFPGQNDTWNIIVFVAQAMFTSQIALGSQTENKFLWEIITAAIAEIGVVILQPDALASEE